MRHYYNDDKVFGKENWFKFWPLYREMVYKAPKDRLSKFVEVGAFRGRSTSFLGVEIINSGKPIELYVVDHFAGSREIHALGINTEPLIVQFSNNLKPVSTELAGRFLVYDGKSVEAAKQFVDCDLDFVFLDGSHETPDVIADIESWYPKIKPGGVIAGDDYSWKSVQIAVRSVFGRDVVTSYYDSFEYPWWSHTKPADLNVVLRAV